MIGTKNVRKAYGFSENSNTGLVRYENSAADAFTKVKANSVLQNIILQNCADFQGEQGGYCLNAANAFPILKSAQIGNTCVTRTWVTKLVPTRSCLCEELRHSDLNDNRIVYKLSHKINDN